MPETEEPKFPEILPVIKEYLEKQQANGEPMRIHFWDTNHGINEPHQVFADKSLHDLVKKFGAPLYAKETFDVTDTKRIIPNSLSDIKGKKAFNETFKNGVKKIDHEIAKLASLGEIVKRIMYDEFTASENPTRIVIPDPREKELKAALTKEEYKQFQRDPFHKNIREKTIPILLGNNFDTSVIDKKIADNINAVFNPERDVQLTLYGMFHFSKQNDLNERMEGLSIAVADKDNLHSVRTFYLHKKEIHNQFPDYVYYANEKRIVKMDDDAAKAEFLGLNAEQFKAWELGKKIDEPMKLPYSPMNKQVSLPISQAHSFSAKTGNNNKQPTINV